MFISQKKKGAKRVVEVSGALTVADSLKLKKTVVDNLRKGNRLELVVGKVTEMDLSFIQVLAAAVKTAEKSGSEIDVKLPLPEMAVENFRVSGFLNHNNCAKPDCIWCSIKEQAQGA